jgi:hypothetical protein
MINPCRSNVLPILITLLSCAGLFIFFNLRLNELKITVEKQNRVLTSFITNVQQDIKASGGGSAPPLAAEPTKHFATPEALVAARKQEQDKIVVSDDEESESESDTESESESDSEEEDGEENGEIKVVNLRGINVVQMMPSMGLEPVSFEVLSCVNLGNESSVASESSITEIIEEEPLNLVNLLGKTEAEATAAAEETTLGKSDATKESYEQMKVDDLRKIVTDKNLCTKEEGKKLKKPELLLLLKK